MADKKYKHPVASVGDPTDNVPVTVRDESDGTFAPVNRSRLEVWDGSSWIKARSNANGALLLDRGGAGADLSISVTFTTAPTNYILVATASSAIPHVTACIIALSNGASASPSAEVKAGSNTKLYTVKPAFIVAVKGFHGKTMGSLSMIGKADYRQPLGLLYGGPVYHVPFGDAEAVERQLEICDTIGVGVAGVLMEPIQGEAGAIVPPDDFWPRIRAATKKHGALLIADEVQTGLGRTGKLWGVEHWDVEPDIIAVAKSLGGGVMPICAVCSTEEIFYKIMYPNPFMQTTTTGGGS